MSYRKLVIILIAFSTIISWSQSSCNLNVSIDGLESDKGKLFVAVYNHEDDFLKTAFTGEVIEIKNGKAIVEFTQLPKGIYAVSAFHDENNNGKLDKNYFGIPKEPNACSNNAKAIFGPPKFKDASFNLEKAETTIKITL